METVLTTHGLTKNYGKIKAVNDVSLEIEKGGIYGLLGPNGSGKTTTLGMILGVIKPTSGSYQWFDNKKGLSVKKRIGALHGNSNFYPYLTAAQNLQVVCKIKEVAPSRIDEVLKFVNLYGRKDSKFKTFSTGMKQRLGLASVLLSDPEVLILDEPTNGLDPQGIAEVRNLIIELGHGSRTIILASHLLDEVEKVCTHTAILKNGTLLASGRVSEIFSPGTTLEISAGDIQKLKQILGELSFVKLSREEKNLLIVELTNESSPEMLNRELMNKGLTLNHLSERKNRLEQSFLKLTGDKSSL